MRRIRLVSGAAVALTALYVAGTCGRALQKLLWSDELFSQYILELDRWTDVWHALVTAVDLNPPLYYVLGRPLLHLPFHPLVSSRALSMLGFWVACACIWAFVSRRAGHLAGVLGALLPVATSAYYYAYEARPYALMLGAGALALVCWQRSGDSQRPVAWRIGLTLSVAATVLSHYFGVLIVLPLVAGEVTRAVLRRRIDVFTASAVVAGLFGLLVCLPLVPAARAYATGWWSPPSVALVPQTYVELFSPALLPAIGFVLLAGILLAARPSDAPQPHVQDRAERFSALPEVAAAVALTMLPVLGLGLGMIVGGYTWRYAMLTVLGPAVLLAFGARWADPSRRLLAAMVAMLVAWTSAKELASARYLLRPAATWSTTYPVLAAEAGSQVPLVISDARPLLELHRYAPPQVRHRLVYLAPPGPRDRWDTGSRSLAQLEPYTNVPIRSYAEFVTESGVFSIYGPVRPVMHVLRRDGFTLEFVAYDDRAEYEDHLMLSARRTDLRVPR